MPWNWRQPQKYRLLSHQALKTAFGAFFLLSLSLFILFCHPLPGRTADDSILNLNQKIEGKKKQISDLQKQGEAYRKKIQETQKRAINLQNQIYILDSSINKTELDIQTKGLEIEELELELELVQAQMAKETRQMEEMQLKMSEILRTINQFESRGYLAIFINQNSFSEIFDKLHQEEILNNTLVSQLQTVKQIKNSLKKNEEVLGGKKEEATAAKDRLNETKITLGEEKGLKKRLFGETKASEGEFQKLLTELRAAEAAIDSEIVTLEKNVRQKLQVTDPLLDAQGRLSWPINPARGITAYFHDAEYPFRYLFEHSGLDIRISQGMPVQSAAGGYVAKIFNGGVGNKPSYVMLIHANNLTTVYMHVSSINVAQDTYVSRGQIIGASGGTPGTSGAGRWTTGPHLHFEVRKNSVPVDPLGYLP